MYFFFFFRFFGKDNVCCYGNIGSLLDLWVEEGGIFQCYYYFGGDDVIFYVINFYYDVLFFFYCCRYFGYVIDRGYCGVIFFLECQIYIKF